MAKQLILTDNFLAQVEETAGYLEETFGKTVADKFAKNAFAKAASLKRFPEKGRRSNRDATIRFLLISKHNRLYYRLKGSKIIALGLFDTRQHPGRNPYEKQS